MKLKINRVLFQGVEYEVCRLYDHESPCVACGLRWYCEKVYNELTPTNGNAQMLKLCFRMIGQKKFLRKTGQENNGREQNA